MINAAEARIKTNETIADIKEQAVKDLMPKVNDVIESAIERGNKAEHIVISDRMTDAQVEQGAELIAYRDNRYVVEAIAEELRQYGYSVEHGNLLKRIDYNEIYISWAEDNAKS